jgi:hypothetical protein
MSLSFRLPVSVGRFAVTVWFGAMLAVGAALLAKHVIALPAPAKDQKLAASLSALRLPDEQGKWLAFHVLYSECRCSQRVVAHLLATTRPLGWAEVVLWVGNQASDPALDQHYRVNRRTSTELARLGIDAAPLLVVLDPQGGLRYVGGYSDRKQGPVLDDLRILAQAQRPGVLASFPVFGCAVTERLKEQLAIIPGL